MSRKSEFKALEAVLQQALAKQDEVSPIEQSYLDQFNNTQTLLNSHDYRNLGSYFNLMPLADMQRMASYGYDNSPWLPGQPHTSTGQAAAGADISGLVQQQHDLDSNELARDYGNMVQNTVAGLQGRNNAIGGAYEGIRDQRLQNGVNGVGMQMNALLHRPHSGLYNFFGANGLGGRLLTAGVGAAAGGLMGGMMGGGGYSGSLTPANIPSFVQNVGTMPPYLSSGVGNSIGTYF